MNANQAVYPVRTMCRVLEVSPSGFYDWLGRAPSAHAMGDALLLGHIRAIHAELTEPGSRVARKRVARLMRQAGIAGVSRRRGFVVTTQRGQRRRPAQDLVQRQLRAEGANRLWVADITYVPTWAGFVYLAVVLEVWSRRVVGWAIGETLAAELEVAAMNMALAQRRASGVIHHSDQGSQYTSLEFGRRCQEMGVRPSMGSVGDAYDNAMAESFFASLECELLNRRSFKGKAEARTALFTYIEGWYNPRRRHSALGYRSPVQFEREHQQTTRVLPSRAEHGLPTVGARVAGAAPPVDNPAEQLSRDPSPA